MKFKTFGILILPLFFSLFLFINGSASSTGIDWHSYDEGIARGKFEKKKLFLHFTAAWCYYCGVMENETFKDPANITSLNANFISIKVDYDREAKTSHYYSVSGLPDTIFIAENGDIIGRRPGYIPPNIMKFILKSILTAGSQD